MTQGTDNQDATAQDVNGPLRIDYIRLGHGRIGMVHCPGRKGRDQQERTWQRDLSADLEAIRTDGAETLVTLIEAKELALYGVEPLPEAVAHVGLGWIHWPVGDMKTASGPAAKAMQAALPALIERVRGGSTIVIHCAAGLGRTGTLAAQMLVHAGMKPDEAIQTVRLTRPGAIETKDQERDVEMAATLRDE